MSASSLTPAKGQPFTEVRPPQLRDLVWARVGNVWYPAQVDNCDPSNGEGRCKVKFFQRVDNHSSAIVRWAPLVRTATAIPTAHDQSNDSLLLFANPQATAASPDSARVDVVGFDIDDEAKGNVAEIQPSMEKLRRHFRLKSASRAASDAPAASIPPQQQAQQQPPQPAPSNVQQPSKAPPQQPPEHQAVRVKAERVDSDDDDVPLSALARSGQLNPAAPAAPSHSIPPHQQERPQQPNPIRRIRPPQDEDSVSVFDNAELADPASITTPAHPRAAVPAVTLAPHNQPMSLSKTAKRRVDMPFRMEGTAKRLKDLPPCLRAAATYLDAASAGDPMLAVLCAATIDTVEVDGMSAVARVMARALLSHSGIAMAVPPQDVRILMATAEVAVDAADTSVKALQLLVDLFCCVRATTSTSAPQSERETMTKLASWSPSVPLLTMHPNPQVREWARRQCSFLDVSALSPLQRDEAALAVAFTTLVLNPTLTLNPTAGACHASLVVKLAAAGELNHIISTAIPSLASCVDLHMNVDELAQASLVLFSLATSLVTHVDWAEMRVVEGQRYAGPSRLLLVAIAVAVAGVASSSTTQAELSTTMAATLRTALKTLADATVAPVTAPQPALGQPVRPPPAQSSMPPILVDVSCDAVAACFAALSFGALSFSPQSSETPSDTPSYRSLLALSNAQLIWAVASEEASRVAQHSGCPLTWAMKLPAQKSFERAMFIAADRLFFRAFDTKTVTTHPEQRQAISGCLHVILHLVWATLASRAITFGLGAGSPALLLQQTPSTVRESLFRFISPSTLHAWLTQHTQLAQACVKLARLEDINAGKLPDDALAPPPQLCAAELRGMTMAVVLGCAVLDTYLHCGSPGAVNPSYCRQTSSAEAIVPPTAVLAVAWSAIESLRESLTPLLTHVLFADHVAIMAANLDGEILRRVEGACLSLTQAAAAHRTALNQERIAAEKTAAIRVVAAIRRLTAHRTPREVDVEQEAVTVAASLSMAAVSAVRGLTADSPFRGAAKQRELDVAAAAWSVTRDALHNLVSCGTTDRRRETLLRSALPTAWAECVTTLVPRPTDPPHVQRVIMQPQFDAIPAPLTIIELVWRLAAAVVEWSIMGMPRDTMLQEVARLPACPPDFLTKLLPRQASMKPALFAALLVSASAAVPEPSEKIMEAVLDRLRALDRDTVSTIATAARDALIPWLADLASHKGIKEAQIAARQQADMERRFAQFERMEKEELRRHQQLQQELAAPPAAARGVLRAPGDAAPLTAAKLQVEQQKKVERERAKAQAAAAAPRPDSDDDTAMVTALSRPAAPLPPLARPTTVALANYGRPPVAAVSRTLAAEDAAFQMATLQMQIDRAVATAKEKLIRCILAQPLMNPHFGLRITDDFTATETIDDGVVGSHPAAMASEWPRLIGPDFAVVNRTLNDTTTSNAGALVPLFAPYIAVELRGDIEATYEQLRRSQSGGAPNSDCLGQAVKVGAVRDDRRGWIVHLKLKRDFDASLRETGPWRLGEGDVFILEWHNHFGDAPLEAAAKSHRRELHGQAAAVARGAPKPFAAVGVGIKPTDTSDARLLAVLVSKDVASTSAWAQATTTGVVDARGVVTVFRVANLGQTNAMLEACGNIGLHSRFWSVVGAPHAHCTRKDVVSAIVDVNDNAQPKGERRPNAKFNDSQIRAISSSVAPMLEKSLSHAASLLPFSLVQGPPGTGKTHTIVGLIVRWLHANAGWIDPARPELGRRCQKRVLVCAPSNIAVDEIGLRLQRHSIRLDNGERWNPVLVRIGVRDSVDPELLKSGIFIDDCIKRYMDAGSPGVSGPRTVDARESVLAAADVVLTTIGSLRAVPKVFPLVIADEAAMTTEPMIYHALQFGCERCVLVGDPAQLQATLRSRNATAQGYGRSLMQRLVSAGYPCTMLNIQFRMHPDIVAFPSKRFYRDQLITAPEVLNEAAVPRTLASNGFIMPPSSLRFAFFDVGGRESVRGSSLINEPEADVVLALANGIQQELGPNTLSSVGIISFYQAQTRLLRDRARALMTHESIDGADTFVNTVDGFQGRERGGVILSCVRSEGGRGGIGFLSDANRVNVALTRAKNFCYIVGDSCVLETQPGVWRDLIQHAIATEAFIGRAIVQTAMDTARSHTRPGELPWLPIPKR